MNDKRMKTSTCWWSSPVATLKAWKSSHILSYCRFVAGLKSSNSLLEAKVTNWAACGGNSGNRKTYVRITFHDLKV